MSFAPDDNCLVQVRIELKISYLIIRDFNLREFQLIGFALDDRFLVQVEIKFEISYSTIKEFTS